MSCVLTPLSPPPRCTRWCPRSASGRSTAPRTPGLARPDRFESRVRTRTNYPVAVPDRTIDPTLRGALIEERDRLLAQIASLEPGHGTSPDFDDNFADSGQVAAADRKSTRLNYSH